MKTNIQLAGALVRQFCYFVLWHFDDKAKRPSMWTAFFIALYSLVLSVAAVYGLV